jgi:2-octaprenyl-6-methoxyphenol hydroxylase
MLIAGGGFAGLTLAIALRRALGPSFTVTVADPMFGRSHADDERASAIVAAVRRLFAALGIWESVADEAQPILDMVVTDSRLDDAVRPVFLTFAGEIEPGEPFAHMIANRFLIAALEAKAKEVGVDLQTNAVASFSYPPLEGESAADSVQHVDVRFTDGAAVTTRLLIAADGARSAIRERAGIAVHGWNYGQSAIVTNVGHERDHAGRAEEHFLPAGPFAILPLKAPARRSASLHSPTALFMPSLSGVSNYISARLPRSARAAFIRSAFSSLARSLPHAWRSWATPLMSSIR